jgi:hypothetical protein
MIEVTLIYAKTAAAQCEGRKSPLTRWKQAGLNLGLA